MKHFEIGTFIGPVDAVCREFFNHSDLKTWLSDWQVKNNRLSPIQCRAMKTKSTNLLQQIEEIEKDLSFTLPLYFSKKTNEEWLGTFLLPIKTKLNEIITTSNSGCISS